MNLLKRVAPGFFALLVCVFSPTAFSQKGAGEININGQIVLAARAGLVDRVVALLGEGAKVNSRDRNGDSPLNMAAAKGNLALVDALLKAQADVNLANVAGVTPLMGAAFSGSAGIMQKLIQAGAKIDPLDRVKKNAATYAAGNGCSACLQVLVLTAISGTGSDQQLEQASNPAPASCCRSAPPPPVSARFRCGNKAGAATAPPAARSGTAWWHCARRSWARRSALVR